MNLSNCHYCNLDVIQPEVQIQRVYDLVYPYFRGKRLDRFAGSFPLDAETRIIDIGGCPTYWQYRRLPGRFTVINLPAYNPPAEVNGFNLVTGDGTNLCFADKCFDIAHSNSVIEHVGTWERQLAFAREVRRVGSGIWVQTPAKYFPVEPHTLDLFVHWFPKSVQRPLLRRFTPWGWITRPTANAIDDFLHTTRLLTYKEMQQLFPDCTILREKAFGLTKSYVAYRPVPG